MTKVEVINGLELGRSESEAWEDLRKTGSALSSPYFSCEWTRHVSALRNDIRIAVILDERGKINGFLPVQQPKGRIAIPVGGALSDYHGLISRPDYKIDLAQIVRQMKIDRLDFSNIPEEQVSFSAFAQIDHDSHIIDLSLGWPGYLQQRRTRGSYENKRARKRARKLAKDIGPIRLEAWSRKQDIFDKLLNWKRNQYRRTHVPDVFASPWASALVQRVFECRGKGGFGGALFALFAGDELVAANFCLADGEVLHSWFIAHNPEFSRYSPGQVLFEQMIENLAGGSIKQLDLGAGDYRFKTALASFSRPLIAGFVAGCPVASAIRGTEYRLRQMVEALPLGRASLLPGKVMRRIDVYRGLA